MSLWCVWWSLWCWCDAFIKLIFISWYPAWNNSALWGKQCVEHTNCLCLFEIESEQCRTIFTMIRNSNHSFLLFLAATKQLYKWYFPSVRLSLTPFWLCSHHRIIMKFSGVITYDQRKVHAKGQGQRSKVKVTEVTTQLNHFRTVTPVWIHIWWQNDAYSLMLLRRGALLFFKVILHTALKIVEFDPDWAFPDCNLSLNSPMATKWCTKLEVALKRCPFVF